ncbi:MAG: phenylacetate-CoA oxygenase subunit PaaJ [Bacteroidetes bacterium]|nr:phenylacetate-CoA oxygenase subunit PaaJ [Bacteroidota bacterium]
MVNTATIEEAKIRALLETVKDPEIPVLSIIDLGMLREIKIKDDKIEVVFTPTYSGCPATDMISATIKMVLQENGYSNVKITSVLSPAWTTDWMTEEGKKKLKSYGIAPPNPKQQVCHQELFLPDEAVQCPRCDSWNTHRISEFGSTACKALYQCDDCKEPFDYFKCH